MDGLHAAERTPRFQIRQPRTAERCPAYARVPGWRQWTGSPSGEGPRVHRARSDRTREGAPEAKILFVFTKTNPATNPAVEALNYIVDNNLATIVSYSYTDPEALPEDYSAWESVAIQANLKGIGLYFATGDAGDHANPGFSYGVSAGFPASLPQVTAVGGTSLGIDSRGHRLFETAWASTLSRLSNGTTLLDGTWQPEYPGSFFAGGGGGTSSLYLQPTYQRGVVPNALTKVASSHRRVVPDVSLLGNPFTGFLVGVTQTFPDGVYYDEFPAGGTSLGTPLLAALVALAEQVRGSRVGFINPTLYRNRQKLVRDIVPQVTARIVGLVYNNSADATDGIGYLAGTLDTELQTLHTTKGYDDTTGLGVPRVPEFVRFFGTRPLVRLSCGSGGIPTPSGGCLPVYEPRRRR